MLSISLLSITLFLLVSIPRSHQYCQNIEPPEHGFVKINEEYTAYEFSCKNGYMLEGRSFVFCNAYQWEKQIPKCIKHVCKDLPNLPNGQIDCDEGPLTPGKVCRFSCFSGYRLQGSSKKVCKFNLQWTGGATCSPIQRECEKPSLLNGVVECDDEDLTLGTRCRFSCFEGYQLQGSRTRSCMHNYQWSGKVKCVPERSYSEPADDSKSVLQLNGRSNSYYESRASSHLSEITNIDPCKNLHCEQLCLIENDGPRCRCCPGYKIDTDKKTCKLHNPRNVNKTLCLLQYKKVGDVVLRECPEGSVFDFDKNDCMENLPQRLPSPISFDGCSWRNGGCEHICTMTDSRTVTCSCNDGYKLHPNGKHCIDVNECSSIDKFGCSHTCVNLRGSAYCACPDGFTLDADRKICIDIDECSRENHCQHYCNNTQGSYFCSCKPSYILIEGYRCEGCRRNSYWAYEKNTCIDCPKNSHTDSEGKRSIKDCVCNKGYIGSPGDYVSCIDIDECSIDNFGCSDFCVNVPGSAYCICPKGFALDSDNKTCIDIDECSIKNGGCEGLCINTHGSFDCICPEGFTSVDHNRYSCVDINECSENNGGCEHDCINYRGGYYCACKPGYHLDSTLRNCTGVQCPKLPLPHYSHMECKFENTTLPEENIYPVGTKCSFICDKGFKNSREDNKMKCKKDGSWKGTLPECKPESCPSLNVPENGEVHPSSCSKYGATVKQKCTFSCHAGYVLKGSSVFVCKNNLTWNNEDIPVCNQVKIQPIIKCPEDIKFTLLKGKAVHNITVPEPITNVEYYEVYPSWVTINEPVEFPVGETQVIFTANTSYNEIAQCAMTVTVLDEEPPVFHFCPDPITIEGAKGSGEIVTWDEPVVTDNVKLVSVFSILEPNTTLTPGTYFVEYVATDSSGNIEKCSFNISIIRMECTDLSDPAHGKANCMDWMFGKLCNPECDDGYMRDPEDPLYYSCDDTGVWEPADFVSECLHYTLATSSSCQDGFERKTVDVTGEEVCIECPSNTVWSSTSRKCEK